MLLARQLLALALLNMHDLQSMPNSGSGGRVHNTRRARRPYLGSGDPAIAAFWQAKRRERKQREWIRQKKGDGL